MERPSILVTYVPAIKADYIDFNQVLIVLLQMSSAMSAVNHLFCMEEEFTKNPICKYVPLFTVVKSIQK